MLKRFDHVNPFGVHLKKVHQVCVCVCVFVYVCTHIHSLKQWVRGTCVHPRTRTGSI